MSARKKKTRKSSTRSRARSTIDAGLRDLERRMPANLRGPVRDLRANLRALPEQIDKARAERDERWRRLERQLRSDAARLLRRLEKAVSGSGSRKASTRKKSGAKKSARRKPARKKTTRKKTTRKKR